MYKYMSGEYFSDTEKVFIAKGNAKSGSDSEIHTHDFIEVVYIFGGTGIHAVNNISYEVKKGDLLFINYGQTHAFTAGKNGMTFYNILIRPELFSQDLLNSENAFELLSLTAFNEFSNSIDKECSFISLDSDSMKKIESILNLLEDEFKGSLRGRRTMLNSLIMAIMLIIFRAMSPDMALHQKSFGNVAEDILGYIESHCHEKLSLKDLADRCFYNPSYFSRLFKETYSMTITEYITKVRIEKSMELLKCSEMTIDNICISVGYSDKTKFYKDFKLLVGKTPAEYRKNKILAHP